MHFLESVKVIIIHLSQSCHVLLWILRNKKSHAVPISKHVLENEMEWRIGLFEIFLFELLADSTWYLPILLSPLLYQFLLPLVSYLTTISGIIPARLPKPILYMFQQIKEMSYTGNACLTSSTIPEKAESWRIN